MWQPDEQRVVRMGRGGEGGSACSSYLVSSKALLHDMSDIFCNPFPPSLRLVYGLDTGYQQAGPVRQRLLDWNRHWGLDWNRHWIEGKYSKNL